MPVMAGLVFSVASGFGATITVADFSFNSPAPPYANSCGSGCSFSLDSVINGWTVNTNVGSAAGLFQPSAGFFSSIPDGNTIGFTGGGTISQTVAANVIAGTFYTLTVDIGLRADLSNTTLGTAELLIGSTPVVALGTTPTPGTFSVFTATYLGSVVDAGKPISIVLGYSGPNGAGQGDFDLVQLTSTATPEPTTAALLGLGLLGFGFLAKRKLVS